MVVPAPHFNRIPSRSPWSVPGLYIVDPPAELLLMLVAEQDFVFVSLSMSMLVLKVLLIVCVVVYVYVGLESVVNCVCRWCMGCFKGRYGITVKRVCDGVGRCGKRS